MDQIKVDALDIAILRELKRNCKEPYRDFAQRLGTHPNTVIQRVHHLEHAGVIKGYSADIDYSKIGYDYHGLIMIRTSKISDSKNLWVFDDVVNIPQIETAYAVTGAYDALATIRVKNREEMVGVLKELQECKVVLKTNTHIILQTFKHAYDYNPFYSVL